MGTLTLTLNIDGISKLPDPLVKKLIQYGLFDPEMCMYTAAKINMNKQHVLKEFHKIKTKIASDVEVSSAIELQDLLPLFINRRRVRIDLGGGIIKDKW